VQVVEQGRQCNYKRDAGSKTKHTLVLCGFCVEEFAFRMVETFFNCDEGMNARNK
jgi:hypothetical protein